MSKRLDQLLARARRLAAPDKVAADLEVSLPAPGLPKTKGPKLVVARHKGDRLSQLMQRRQVLENPGEYVEVRRICNIPIRPDMTPEEIESFNRGYLLAPAYDSGWRMWGVQCMGIKDYREDGGLFCPIGVGWGKTILTQAVASEAYRKGLRKIMLLVPSQVLGQLVGADFPYARARIPINYPVHVISAGRSLKSRTSLARSGKKGLYIFPYSLLSQKNSSDLLNWIGPELIMCDEADYLGNPGAARTRRVMHYVNEREPEGVCLSGTITDKSIKDYYHLIKWCLRVNCPLPLQPGLASEWSSKIDAAAISSDATGPIMPLVQWAERHFPLERIQHNTDGFRLAYKLRLKSTPGVIATGDAEIKPSLILHNEVAEGEQVEGWERLEQLRTDVEKLAITPNGDPIEHPIHCYKWLYELSSGFYNELRFPEPGEYAERHGVTEEQARRVIDEARVHHRAHQLYSSALGKWIEDHASPGRMDTPMLVGSSMHQHGARDVGRELFALWKSLKACEKSLSGVVTSNGWRGTPKELRKAMARSMRWGEVIRVCPFKIQHAVRWAARLPKKSGAILWIYHQGIGRWLFEALQEAGLNPLYCPAGDKHSANILDPANGQRVIVASLRAHGVGKNLQHFDQQLYVQWPRNAKMAEQSLGRMHRNGQKSTEVWAHTCRTTEFDRMCFAATLNDALYIHQTTGNRQKMIYATYSPGLPEVFPTAVLRERGFQNKALTPAQQKALNEKFGSRAPM